MEACRVSTDLIEQQNKEAKTEVIESREQRIEQLAEELVLDTEADLTISAFVACRAEFDRMVSVIHPALLSVTTSELKEAFINSDSDWYAFAQLPIRESILSMSWDGVASARTFATAFTNRLREEILHKVSFLPGSSVENSGRMPFLKSSVASERAIEFLVAVDRELKTLIEKNNHA